MCIYVCIFTPLTCITTQYIPSSVVWCCLSCLHTNLYLTVDIRVHNRFRHAGKQTTCSYNCGQEATWPDPDVGSPERHNSYIQISQTASGHCQVISIDSVRHLSHVSQYELSSPLFFAAAFLAKQITNTSTLVRQSLGYASQQTKVEYNTLKETCRPILMLAVLTDRRSSHTHVCCQTQSLVSLCNKDSPLFLCDALFAWQNTCI